MTKLSAICGMLLFVSTAFAGQNDIYGHYSQRSGVRLFTTKAACEADGAEFDETSSSGDKTDSGDLIAACYYLNDSGNIIDIEKDENSGKSLVHINVVYGAADMRGFDGVVVKQSGNSIVAREAEISGGRMGWTNIGAFTKNGCIVKISMKDGTASLKLGKNCDGNLNRADGATKK